MIRIFLCIHSFTLIKEIIERTSSLPSVDVVGLTTVLPKYTAVLQDSNIDVLFLDCTYEQAEAISFGRKIQQADVRNMKIVYLFNAMDDQIMQYILKDNIHNYLCRPFSTDNIIRMISNEVGNSTLQQFVHHNSKESYMVQVMQGLSLPVHLQGYAFLKSASTLVLTSSKDLHMSMKLLYKEVARMHATTTSRVEKSIRNTIEFAYRVAPQKIAIQGKKPTNSQVIHYISEQVYILEIDQESKVKK